MVQHYDQNIEFRDPAFGVLTGSDACNMWRMLIERGGENLNIEYSNIRNSEDKVLAHWEAKYPFSKTGRKVHNRIEAEFEFLNDKIIKHRDSFDLWRWSAMALGIPGTLLGWSPMLQSRIRKQCLYFLSDYIKKYK